MDVVGVRVEPADLSYGAIDLEYNVVYISLLVYNFTVELIFVFNICLLPIRLRKISARIPNRADYLTKPGNQVTRFFLV